MSSLCSWPWELGESWGGIEFPVAEQMKTTSHSPSGSPVPVLRVLSMFLAQALPRHYLEPYEYVVPFLDAQQLPHFLRYRESASLNHFSNERHLLFCDRFPQRHSYRPSPMRDYRELYKNVHFHRIYTCGALLRPWTYPTRNFVQISH